MVVQCIYTYDGNKADISYFVLWSKSNVIFLYSSEAFVSIGCWKDRGARAIPTLEGKDGRLKGNYQQRKDAIKLCYEAAKARGFQIFAIQHGGWCAAAKGGNISISYIGIHLPSLI